MKRALSLLLALLMAASLVMPQAWAAGLQEPEPDAVVEQTQPDTAEPDARQPQADTLAGNAAGLTPITRTKNAVASGVTLEKVVMRNVNGSQVVGYLSEIDLSKDVTLKASYTGYYYDGSTAAQRSLLPGFAVRNIGLITKTGVLQLGRTAIAFAPESFGDPQYEALYGSDFL